MTGVTGKFNRTEIEDAVIEVLDEMIQQSDNVLGYHTWQVSPIDLAGRIMERLEKGEQDQNLAAYDDEPTEGTQA